MFPNYSCEPKKKKSLGAGLKFTKEMFHKLMRHIVNMKILSFKCCIPLEKEMQTLCEAFFGNFVISVHLLSHFKGDYLFFTKICIGQPYLFSSVLSRETHGDWENIYIKSPHDKNKIKECSVPGKNHVMYNENSQNTKHFLFFLV